MKIEAITNVKQVQEYFESYKRTNNTEYLDRITDYLDTCKAHDIIIDYGDIRELLCQNSKGDSLLEVILRNEDKIDFVTILKIQSTKYSDNYPDLIESFFLKKPELLKYLDAKSLVYATVNGERLIDYMFKNNLISIANVQKCTKYYEEMIECAFKYHREDLLQHLPSRVLLRNENGKTIAEDLIDRGVVFDQPKRLIDSNLVEILIKKRQFLALKKLDEKILLKKSSNGKTILEILLDYNIDFDESVILRDYRSIGIIIEKERFDLLKNIGLELLVQDNPGGKTWLEYFIALHNDGAEINFSQIQLNLHNITSKNLESIADFYLTMAENGLIEHIRGLNSYHLLIRHDGKCLLDVLLEKNKELTLNVILDESTKSDFHVATYLKLNGIEQQDIDIELHSMDVVDKFLDVFISRYKKEEITEEQKGLIREFREIMSQDNKSDPSLVDAVAAIYQHLMHTGNPLGEIELRKLIEIKRVDPEFSIKKESSRFYYEQDNSIHVSNSCISVLTHELGHFLYANLTDREEPNEYHYLRLKLQEDPEFLKRVEDFARKYQEIREKVIKTVEEEFIPEYEKTITDEKKEELKEFIAKSIEEKKEIYKSLNYSDDVIDIILERTYSLEEYLKQDKRIKTNELADALIRTKYPEISAIGDILDAIFDGKFYSDELRTSDGRLIPSGSGHGLAYYRGNPALAFEETIAQFSLILKSDEASESLDYLRSIVGERFVELLTNYYDRDITQSTKAVRRVSKKR